MRTTRRNGASLIGGEQPAVLCRGLVKRYPDVLALAGIDLTVLRGECFGLLGPNGAGKTTTVEILEGLTAPDAGLVEVLGCQWGTGSDRELRQRLGVALQETKLAEKLTVEETIRLFRSFYRRGHAVDEVIEMVGLAEKRRSRVGKLSGGQQQRLALACALVSDPELLFLDEPTTGLDPQARLNVWSIVEGFLDVGGTVLLTTHYMDEAARLCGRIAIVDHGRIIGEGSPGELIASLGADQIVELDVEGELDGRALVGVSGVGSVDRRDDGWMLSVNDVASALPAILAAADAAGARLKGLRTHQATLEDVFVHLTGRGLRDG